MKLWWLSFAGDDENLGLAIVRAESLPLAVLVTHMLGINPGGEVLGVEIPSDMERLVPDSTRNRLLSKADAALFMGPMARVDSNMNPLEEPS